MSLVNQMLQDLQQRHADEVKPLAGLRVVSSNAAEVPKKSAPGGRPVFIVIAVAAIAIILVGISANRNASESSAEKTALVPDRTEEAVNDSEKRLTVMQPRPAAAVASAPLAPLQVSKDAIARSEVSQLRPALQSLRIADLSARAELVKPAKSAVKSPPRVPEPRRAAGRSPQRKAVVPPKTVAAIEPVKTQLPPEQRLQRDASAAIRNGKLREAEQMYQQLVGLQPGNTDAHRSLYRVQKSMGKSRAAQSTLQAALVKTENVAEFATLLAHDLLAGNQAAEAAAVLGRNRSRVRGNAQYDALYAGALQRAGRHMQAIAIYQSMLASDSTHGAWWVGLGISQEAIGQLPAARQSFAAATLISDLDETLSAYAFERLAILETRS